MTPTRVRGAIAAFALLAAVLAGCASTPAEDSNGTPAPAASETPAATAPAELMTADSSLGEIVVDGKGMTVYMFDKDTQKGGASTCEGQCATNWPAVTTDSAMPAVEGVTGEVGTIEGVDGAMQVTLNGWPLYYFAGDAAAGDVKGQGVNGVWWVLTPAGERHAG